MVSAKHRSWNWTLKAACIIACGSCGAPLSAGVAPNATPVVTQVAPETRSIAQYKVARSEAPLRTAPAQLVGPPELGADIDMGAGVAEAWQSARRFFGLLPESEPEVVQVRFRLGEEMPVQTFGIALDGTVDPDDRMALRRLFRCKRTARTHRMNRNLYAKLADLSKHFDGAPIEVVSAYRHGPHAGPRSRHRHGRAIDIKVEGVKAAVVRDYLWSRYSSEVGVGYYQQQQFVHLDHRDNFPRTAWTQRRHSAKNIYRPRWSRAETPPSPSPVAVAVR